VQFLGFVNQENLHIDCLIFQNSPVLQALLNQLRHQAVFLPAVVLNLSLQDPISEGAILTKFDTSQEFAYSKLIYHPAVVELPFEKISLIEWAIETAISKFIQLLPMGQACSISPDSVSPDLVSPDSVSPDLALPASVPLDSVDTQIPHKSLVAQQMRLAEKLKERLGYLGIYYKRSSKNFLRYMSLPQRQELLQQLKADYREIILSYFSQESGLNQKIDNFVNIAFFADVPIAQIVEIHMGLMDEFSKQLKLEGRSDEILQDYRLTLIDTIAHLCEMYRRSIPREPISKDQ
jgi:circadian clock protein KaiA